MIALENGSKDMIDFSVYLGADDHCPAASMGRRII